jgi:hypothetical protein
MTASSQSTRRKLSLLEQLPVALPEILTQKRGASSSGILLSLDVVGSWSAKWVGVPPSLSELPLAVQSRRTITLGIALRWKPSWSHSGTSSSKRDVAKSWPDSIIQRRD